LQPYFVMSLFGWIFFGFIVGLFARKFKPDFQKDPLGLIGTTVLGILGALAAGAIGRSLGWYGPNQSAGFLAASIGAAVALGIYYGMMYCYWFFRKRRGRPSQIQSAVLPSVKEVDSNSGHQPYSKTEPIRDSKFRD